MLNRRHIRIKVMQTLFAFDGTEASNFNTDQKFLVESMDGMYDLYLLMMSLLIEIHKRSEDQYNKLQNRLSVDTKKVKASKHLVDNQLLMKISNNKSLTDTIANRKINLWDLDFEYVDILYKKVVKSDLFLSYSKKQIPSFEDDKYFIVEIFKTIIAPNEKLYDYLEDKKITWIDDLPIVNTNILKLLKQVKFNSTDKYFLPELYKDDDDKQFAIQLFQKTILNKKELTQAMFGKTTNWDSERLASLDALLLTMAICEFQKFPFIPVKVTINEYLEIAKEYSTPKSSTFINGVLDNLAKEYQNKNAFNKVGRGLI